MWLIPSILHNVLNGENNTVDKIVRGLMFETFQKVKIKITDQVAQLILARILCAGKGQS